MGSLAEQIAHNVDDVKERIANAAARSGRRADDVTLVAVTKYVDAATTRHLVAAGCTNLGESRPQALWQKAESLADLPQIQWHQIGHMQRNKLARTLPLISLLHSVDSDRLVATIEELSQKLSVVTPILLEVDISGEQSKHGFTPNDVDRTLETISTCSNISLRGLMGMASRAGGIDRARKDFIALRELRDSLLPKCPSNVSLDEISMGMSGDFEVAIEEGATIVRVGSALFP